MQSPWRIWFVKLLGCVWTEVVIAESPSDPVSLKSTGTRHAKRCEGPASQGKRVHFRKVQKSIWHWVHEDFLKAETRRAAKAEAEPRSPQGGRQAPTQVSGRCEEGRGKALERTNDNLGPISRRSLDPGRSSQHACGLSHQASKRFSSGCS